jgi:hypothetical protein
MSYVLTSVAAFIDWIPTYNPYPLLLPDYENTERRRVPIIFQGIPAVVVAVVAEVDVAVAGGVPFGHCRPPKMSTINRA